MIKSPSDEKDLLNLNFIDFIETRHNFYFEYHGGPKKDETTIVPFQISLDIKAALRKGIGSRHGHT